MIRRWTLLLSAAVQAIAIARADSAPGLVGLLKDQNAIDGCSWSASSISIGRGFIFLAEYDESIILMNIGGKDVHLRLDPKQSKGAIGKVGSHLTEIYTAPGVRIDAAYTVTWACPANDESCEVTKFDVTFDVQKGESSQIVHAKGDVGC